MSTESRGARPLTPRQREVLMLLSGRTQWSVGEIATALGVSSAAATKAVTRLENRGIVTRSENKVDHRRVDVCLKSVAAETNQFTASTLEEDRNSELSPAASSRKEERC
jgi:DNA-binding Lrp family transcriptional regulator